VPRFLDDVHGGGPSPQLHQDAIRARW